MGITLDDGDVDDNKNHKDDDDDDVEDDFDHSDDDILSFLERVKVLKQNFVRGRQSCTKLATFIANYELFQIEVSKAVIFVSSFWGVKWL